MPRDNPFAPPTGPAARRVNPFEADDKDLPPVPATTSLWEPSGGGGGGGGSDGGGADLDLFAPPPETTRTGARVQDGALWVSVESRPAGPAATHTSGVTPGNAAVSSSLFDDDDSAEWTNTSIPSHGGSAAPSAGPHDPTPPAFTPVSISAAAPPARTRVAQTEAVARTTAPSMGTRTFSPMFSQDDDHTVLNAPDAAHSGREGGNTSTDASHHPSTSPWEDRVVIMEPSRESFQRETQSHAPLRDAADAAMTQAASKQREDATKAAVEAAIAASSGRLRLVEAERDLLRDQLRSLESRVDAAARGATSTVATPEAVVEDAITTGILRAEHLRSVRDKADLIDAAIIAGRGDVLARCCAFAAMTLQPEVLHGILRERPAAVRQRAATLRSKNDSEGLIALFDGVGWVAHAAHAAFERAVAEHEPKKQAGLLEKCIPRIEAAEAAGVESRVILGGLSSAHVRSSLALMKTQHGLDIADRGATTQPFQRWPKKRGTLGMPALTTLWYGWLYHADDDKNHPGHPTTLQKNLGATVSEQQFLWTGVRARAKAGDWDSVDALLTRKTKFFGAAKLKPAISPAGIARVLLSATAPKAVVAKYIALVDDAEARFALYAESGLHMDAVKTLIEIKDAERLEAYYTRKDVNGDFQVRQLAFDTLQKWSQKAS